MRSTTDFAGHSEWLHLPNGEYIYHQYIGNCPILGDNVPLKTAYMGWSDFGRILWAVENDIIR